MTGMDAEPKRATPDGKRWWFYLAVFLLALAVRGVHLVAVHDSPLFATLIVDAREYDRWAQEIAAGNWLGREVFYQAPLYPYFLGVNYAILGHDLLAVRVVQIFLGSLACLFLALAGSRFFSFPVGIAAGVLLALYPVAIFFDTIIQKSALDLFLMTLLLFLVATLLHRPRWHGWLCSGLILGLFALTRENALVLLPVIGLWLWLHFRAEPVRIRLQWSALVLAGMTAVLFPVGLRNRIVGGEFFITTSQFGPNLYMGNHAGANGQYIPLRWGRCTPEFERLDATELAEAALGRKVTPRDVSRYWTGKVVEYVRENPGQWLLLMARKWLLTWNAAELVDAEDVDTYGEYSWLLRILNRVFHFGVLCPLAAFGLAVTWKQRDRLWVLYAIVLSVAASVAMFYVFARYRYPMVPVLMLFGAVAMVEGRRMLLQRDLRNALIGVSLALVIAVTVNLPLVPAASARATTEYNLGRALQEQGKLQEATSHYREALRRKPDFVQAHFNLATVLTATGDLPGAIEQYERSLQFRPDYADAHNNLAGLFDEAGRWDEAIAQYRQALQINPNQANVHYNLAGVLAGRGAFGEALTHYAEAVRLVPGYLEAHVNMAIVLDRQGKPEKATEHYLAALRIDPNSVETHYNFALSLTARGETAEAIRHYREVLRLRPDFAPAKGKLDSLLASERKTQATP